MENLMAQSISKPPITIPTKQDTTWDFSNRPNVASVPFSRKRHQVVTDSYVNYLCKTGRLSEAVAALDSLAQHGSEVRPDTFLNLVQSCIDSNSLILGRKVHSRIGLVKHKSPFLETKLVSMYAKCGNLEDARKVFAEMGERNLFTWSAMIGACSRERRYREVIELFYMMMSMEDSCLPDAFLLPKILQACGNCGDLKTGKLIHLLVVKCGMGDVPRVSNSILAVYAKCGKLGVAERYFERMEQKDTAAWNAMMSGYCQIGDVEKAHRLFDAMCEEGTDPGLVSWNLLISGYNQIGRCDVAMELKKKMESNGIALDVVAWTSMISGFGQNNRTNQALDLFREMILTGVEPNGVTIASVVSACASLKSLNAGMEIHSLAVKLGNIHDVLVGNSLIDLYSKCGDLEAARQVYDLMAEKDVFSWNSMIGGYCQAGYCGKAYLLFTQLQNSNIQPNVITWNTMIWGYLQNGDEDQAMDLFQKMEKEGNIKRDTASWNSLIAGHIHIGQKDLALSIFRQMQSAGIRPNPVTILSVLPACASLIALNQVKEIHGCALRRNLVSALPVVNSLIDNYTKSGNIAYSRRLFDRIISKDVITFNSMIAGYNLYACPDAALDIFDQMRISGIKPSRTTFASIILAQSLAGKVDMGKQAFSNMVNDCKIIPTLEHYSAMVDLYGRSGRLGEALAFIEDMPIKPDSSIWSTFLTACLIHGNFDMAMQARENLVNSEPRNSSINQSNLQGYALYGKVLDALKVKKVDGNGKVPKLIGQSWIEVKKKVHSFVTGNCPKFNPDVLFSWAERISSEIKAQDLGCGFYKDEIEEEEREEIVGIHSEKLALAFALVSSPSTPQSIRIVKNIRMCGECHGIAKYITLKYGCEIYLSDARSFHHFKSGKCSCRDYW